MLALALLDEGKSEESLVQAELEPDEFWRLWAMSIAKWKLGQLQESDLLLVKIISDHAPGNEFQIGEVYGVRGEIDEAFAWLERGIAKRDPGMTHAKVSPRLKNLRDDPRWTGMLSRIGF